MQGNELKVTILPDGRIKVETDAVSPALHTTADAFLGHVFRLAGGAVERKHRPGGTGHSHNGHDHDHGHNHTHGGH